MILGGAGTMCKWGEPLVLCKAGADRHRPCANGLRALVGYGCAFLARGHLQVAWQISSGA